MASLTKKINFKTKKITFFIGISDRISHLLNWEITKKIIQFTAGLSFGDIARNEEIITKDLTDELQSILPGTTVAITDFEEKISY